MKAILFILLIQPSGAESAIKYAEVPLGMSVCQLQAVALESLVRSDETPADMKPGARNALTLARGMLRYGESQGVEVRYECRREAI